MKIIGLLALAALMAMAIVGASSATAESTALCLEDPGTGAHEVCPAGQLVTHVHDTTQVGDKATLLTSIDTNNIVYVHEATLSGRKAILLSSVVTVECNVLFSGRDFQSSTTPVIAGSFTYTQCETASGSACEVSEIGEGAILEMSASGHELAGVSYEFEVLAQCSGFIHCTYNGEGLEGHALGPLLAEEENGEIRIEKLTLTKVGGFLCPKKTTLDLLTTPSIPTYIPKEGTLCRTDPGKLKVCPIGEGVNPKCDVLFLGEVTPENGLGNLLVILGNFTYTNCETAGLKCEVGEISKHALIEVLKLGHELADVTGSAEVLVECSGFIHCTYNGSGLTGHGLGPLLTLEKENGEVRIEKQIINKVSGFLCPKTATLDLLITPLKETSITE